MKHLIRATALTLCALLLILALAACGGTSGGFAFRAPNGTEVTIGADATSAVEALGAHLSINESASCGGIPGMDRVYSYKGFRVKTTPAEGGDIVCQIELTDDSVKTPEGIYIGMSEADAKTAMSGKGTPETVGSNLVYKSGTMKLQILVRDGYVTGVLYVTA